MKRSGAVPFIVLVYFYGMWVVWTAPTFPDAVTFGLTVSVSPTKKPQLLKTRSVTACCSLKQFVRMLATDSQIPGGTKFHRHKWQLPQSPASWTQFTPAKFAYKYTDIYLTSSCRSTERKHCPISV